MKIDKHGHLIWARSYGKKYRDFANTLYVGEANNCYVAGSTRSFSHKIQDVLLMKVDSTGHLQWARAYGGPHDDICYDMVRTKDLGFALVGGARSFHTVNEKPFVLKLNAVGGYEWFKPVSTTQKGKALAIGETPNRALIVAMHMGEKAFVSRLSSHGNISWTQTQKEEGLTIKRINTLPNESILLLGNKNNKMELNKLAGYSAKNCSLEDGKIKFSIARPIAFTPILHTKPKAPIISYIGKVSDVKLLQRNGCSEMGTTIQKEFNPLGENRTLCDNKMILDAGKGFSYYQWHNGSRSQLFVATAPGEYWVTVSDGCNLYTDTIQLLKCENNKVEEPKEVAPEKLKVKPKILSELQVGDKIVVKNLLFHQGTDTPIDPAYVAINDIYLYMKDRPNSVIELLGHTDNQGRHYLNLKLSKKRVEKVKDILEARGISPERVIISFYGGKYPIASNIDENTRRLNRRVELKIISL